MDLNQVVDIFYSNFNAGIDYDAAQELADLLVSDYIKIEKVEICSTTEFDKILEKVLSGKIGVCDYDGGGKKHITLKIIAGNYVEKKLHQKVNFEAIYYGRRPDVISKDESIIVECGDTDPRKILEYFENNENIKVYILPYSHAEDEKLFAYLFTKNKSELSDYLHTKKVSALSDVRKIIASRK